MPSTLSRRAGSVAWPRAYGSAAVEMAPRSSALRRQRRRAALAVMDMAIDDALRLSHRGTLTGCPLSSSGILHPACRAQRHPAGLLLPACSTTGTLRRYRTLTSCYPMAWSVPLPSGASARRAHPSGRQHRPGAASLMSRAPCPLTGGRSCAVPQRTTTLIGSPRCRPAPWRALTGRHEGRSGPPIVPGLAP